MDRIISTAEPEFIDELNSNLKEKQVATGNEEINITKKLLK